MTRVSLLAPCLSVATGLQAQAPALSLERISPFAASMGVAAVTDWTLNDTANIQRCLGLPPGGDGGKAAPRARSRPYRSVQFFFDRHLKAPTPR